MKTKTLLIALMMAATVAGSIPSTASASDAVTSSVSTASFSDWLAGLFVSTDIKKSTKPG
ncbi:MAG TPA: hypothetical protein VHE37_10115 [Nevskiaceae bacterium]|nr:hypothetical protein [Nevskiaceae bacterium]